MTWRDILMAVAWIALIGFILVAIIVWTYGLVTTIGAQ